MNISIIYSSRTGNTKKVARAIREALPCHVNIFSVDEHPNVNDCDLIFLGYWVDKGIADSKTQAFMKNVSNKNIALFGTSGAYPDSNHAKDCIKQTVELLPTCTVIDSFLCQGAIDPKLIDWMKSLPKDDPHGPNEERLKLWDDASIHPNEQDVQEAKEWAHSVLEHYLQII